MLILGDEAWLAVIVPVHPKCAPEDWGQRCVQAGNFTQGLVMLEQERSLPKLLPQSWKHTIVQCHCVV